jgi:hypothetical protein
VIFAKVSDEQKNLHKISCSAAAYFFFGWSTEWGSLKLTVSLCRRTQCDLGVIFAKASYEQKILACDFENQQNQFEHVSLCLRVYCLSLRSLHIIHFIHTYTSLSRSISKQHSDVTNTRCSFSSYHLAVRGSPSYIVS